MGPAYGSQFYELVIMNKRVDGENSWEVIPNEEKEEKITKIQGSSGRKKERGAETYYQTGTQQTNLNQGQLNELGEIVFPNKNNYNFIELKEEIRKIKIENLTSQIENKEAELEQLLGIMRQERLHHKTKKELQEIVQKKKVEVSQLQTQLDILQRQQSQNQIQVFPK
jgi:hypothetical protein